MDKIARVRQEIKRLRKEIKDEKDPLAPNQKAGYLFALTDMESFLDTLSEEPMQKFNTDKLQEIAKPATPHKKPTPEDRAKFMEELHEYSESKKPDKSLEEAAELENLALLWASKRKSDYPPVIDAEGCEHEQYDFTDLMESFKAGWKCRDEQMPMPEDTVLFNKGVQEGRRLEREDSVECEVTDVGFNYLDLALFDAESLELKAGDKIKVIVLKDNEDESK